MANRRFALLVLLNLLLCGGFVLHYVYDALCGVGEVVCISAETDATAHAADQDSKLHSGYDTPPSSSVTVTAYTAFLIALIYHFTWRYMRPPRLRPPILA